LLGRFTKLPKAGKYDYPFFDLDACIDKLREYYDINKTDETRRALVAETLHMKMKGGGFANLMSSMEKYGLIKTGGGNVTITSFGKAILYGEPTEVLQAKKKAVSSIDLFRELHEQYGKDIQLEQIRAFLRQKGNVDISKVEKLAQNIGTIYKKVLNYIIPVKKLEPASEGISFKGSSIGRRRIDTQSEEGKTELLKIQYGDLYIEVPKEDAETALRLIAQKLGIKLNPEK
jgi:hypothetical protein